MKKIVTFCVFAFALLVGTQNVSAQSMIEINSLAAKKTQELKKVVKFNADTEDLVYKAFQNYEQKLYSINTNSSTKESDLKKLDQMLHKEFEGILSPEEFQRYKDSKAN